MIVSFGGEKVTQNPGFLSSLSLKLVSADTFLLLLPTQQEGNAKIFQKSNAHSDCQNALSWTKQKSQHIGDFTDTDSSIFQGHILHSTHTFICFSQKTVGIQHLLHRSHCFWSWKTTQKTSVLVLSVFWKLLSRFQSLCNIFPQFITKFDVLTQFFQACHFLGIWI